MPKSIYLETFGCQMNELDSELVAGRLRALGYQFTSEPDSADVVLYNTCSVREHAEQKVWSRLGELAIRKRDEPGLVVGVLGCLAERDGTALITRMPVVDILCGPGELDKLPTLLDNAVRTRASLLSDSPSQMQGTPPNPSPREGLGRASSSSSSSSSSGSDPVFARAATQSARQIALQGNTSRRSGTLAAAEDSLEMLDLSRAISPVDVGNHTGVGSSGPRASAYVRITRGCNKFCTYCVVPFTRGAEVHRPPDHIVDECKKLADAGVVEITLLGQTVNHYRFEHGSAVTVNGHVQPQKGRSYTGGHRRDPFAGANVTTFADLLRRLHDEVPAILRLRFVTSYPRDFGDDVLEVMRDHPRICRYLHVPGQSGSDRILKLMNRGYTVGEYTEFLARARQFLDQPEIGRPLMVSGDVIVGFPTETDEDFAATVTLVTHAQYKNCFIFKYSPRPGTSAYDKFADDVPDAVKRRRNNELLALQDRISDAISREQVGRVCDVLVEGLSRRERKKDRARAACAGAATTLITVGGRSLADPDAPPSAGSDDSAVDRTEEATSFAPVQLSARTDGDNIVFIALPDRDRAERWIGRVAPVRITSASVLALHGELV